MPAGQRERRPLVVIKDGWGPALLVVATGACRLRLMSGELRSMRIGVAGFTRLRSPFELNLLLPWRRLVAARAGHGPVHAQQWEFRFRVIEASYICPGSGSMASLASELAPIRTPLFRTVAEFTVMRIRVARRAGFVFEPERQNLVRASCRAGFVAIHARHGHVRSGERKLRVAVLGNRKQRAVEVRDCVTGLTSVFIG